MVFSLRATYRPVSIHAVLHLDLDMDVNGRSKGSYLADLLRMIAPLRDINLHIMSYSRSTHSPFLLLSVCESIFVCMITSSPSPNPTTTTSQSSHACRCSVSLKKGVKEGKIGSVKADKEPKSMICKGDTIGGSMKHLTRPNLCPQSEDRIRTVSLTH